ncbi:hypothetical protein D8674_020834 [Pyrus ussuriensis x Pyrus communis]|uniref:Uncharacterized protein n=1 Tax=Pyrus ussuriensis x Pyrus communis TaxID=2448454 RepID=A0A5N5HGS7_9ROSA|nr:hypothetical protein D8674_020834 [Pyrus ussuriensis x Pyrus communis]
MIYQNYLPEVIFLSLIKQAEQPVSLYGSCRFRSGGSVEHINRGIVISVGYDILD